MRLVIVWRDNTDYAREVANWMEEFSAETGREVESLDPDTVEGEMFVRARDIMRYPAVVAIDDRGSVLKQWLGTPLPQFDEVSYYTQEM